MKKLALFLSMQGVTFNTRKRQIAIVSYVQQHDKSGRWWSVARKKYPSLSIVYYFSLMDN